MKSHKTVLLLRAKCKTMSDIKCKEKILLQDHYRKQRKASPWESQLERQQS